MIRIKGRCAKIQYVRSIARTIRSSVIHAHKVYVSKRTCVWRDPEQKTKTLN